MSRKAKYSLIEKLMDRHGKRKEADELTESDKLSAQLKLVEAENRCLKMENDFLKKIEGSRKKAINTRILQEYKYISIK